MRTNNRPRLHALTPSDTGRRASRADRPATRRVRPQLVADGVVAGYIHEISIRHRDATSRVDSYVLSPAAEAA